MQLAFGFGSTEIARWHDRLRPALAGIELHPPRRPAAQLAKSIISSRTRDAVSAAAFERLRAAFPSAALLAAAEPRAVEQVIADVTFAEDKAVYLVEAMRQLRARGRRLETLSEVPVAQGLALLEALPGVGRKVSASTLNASTLALPVMIVDTHVLRVLRRLRMVPPNADYRTASETVTAAMPGWSGQDFLHFHVELKLLGQTLCRPDTPLCHACPLADDCLGKWLASGR